MTWVVQHYIPLAGAGTAYDPDPSVTQPGKVAKDGAGNDLPVTRGDLTSPWCDLQVIDAAGLVLAVGAETFTVVIAKRTTSLIIPAVGTVARPQFAWTSGPSASAVSPGTQLVQAQVESPNLFTAVVTAGVGAPATGRLAVRVWRQA